jgi:hypothetical protein
VRQALGFEGPDLVGLAQVRPMSSKPLSRQYLRNACTSNGNLLALWLDDHLALQIDRQLVARERRPREQGGHLGSGSTIGNRPFLKLLLKKMSAKLGAMMARKPYWSSAQGACSRDEPQPKFLRASRMEAHRRSAAG